MINKYFFNFCVYKLALSVYNKYSESNNKKHYNNYIHPYNNKYSCLYKKYKLEHNKCSLK